MTERKYFLVLFQKKDGQAPNKSSYKPIKEQEYLTLTRDFKSSIEVMGRLYIILERRWFEIEDNSFVVIDAVRA